MAEGIRVRPRAGLNWPDGALVVIVDHARPHPPPKDGTPLERVQPVCNLCGVQHFAKTYHIQLQGGAAIVSTGVWASLNAIADNPFEVVNNVAKPPTQELAIPSNGSRPVIDHRGDILHAQDN